MSQAQAMSFHSQVRLEAIVIGHLMTAVATCDAKFLSRKKHLFQHSDPKSGSEIVHQKIEVTLVLLRNFIVLVRNSLSCPALHSRRHPPSNSRQKLPNSGPFEWHQHIHLPSIPLILGSVGKIVPCQQDEECHAPEPIEVNGHGDTPDPLALSREVT